MRLRLICNLAASATTRRTRAVATEVLEPLGSVEVVETAARLHASELAARAVSDEVDAVFCLGGDGTANEVLQALAGTDVPLGVLPGGTTNVLVRSLDLPRDVAGAAHAQAARLADDHDRRLGLGEVNGRYFAFQAGVGFDAGVVRRVEANPRLKRAVGQAAFVLLGLREWATSPDRREPACVVTAPRRIDPRPRMLVTVANLGPTTYLGPRPLRLLPDADPDAGLDVLLADRLGTAAALSAVARALADASHTSMAGLEVHRDLPEVSVTARRPVPLVVDGDVVGTTRTATFRHHPGALRLLA